MADGARRRFVLRLGALALGAGAAARAADGPPPDTDLLEFLGSDDDDPDLQQYAARQDEPSADHTKPAPPRADGRT